MALPPKNGWIIEFLAARSAFDAFDNELIDAFIDMCEGGTLFCCRCEGDYFREHDGLKPPFIEDQDCRLDLDDDIIHRLEAVEGAVNGGLNGKVCLPGATNPQEIVATALRHDFGVVTNKISPQFITTRDLCVVCGVTVMSTAEFKAAL